MIILGVTLCLFGFFHFSLKFCLFHASQPRQFYKTREKKSHAQMGRDAAIWLYKSLLLTFLLDTHFEQGLSASATG